jgi:Flp pilus assembly pilin Flp
MVSPIGVAGSSVHDPLEVRRPAAGNDRLENQMLRLHRLRALYGHVAGHDRGQGLAEYALILALIAIIAIVALIFLGGQVSKVLSDVGHSI